MLTISSDSEISMAEGHESGVAFVPLPVRQPADQVRLTILDAIVSGKLKPGDRLPSEHEQARAFRVGRSVVREALRSLAQLGLISVVPGRQGGSFVNRLDAGPVERSLREAMDLLVHFEAITIAELVEARRSIECVCAGLSALRRTDAELAIIRETIESAQDDSLSDDRWLDLDIQFHRAVARSAHNRALILPLAALHGVTQPRLNQAILPFLSRARVNGQHRAVCAAIRAREPEAARLAVERHLDYLESLYRKSGLLRRRRSAGGETATSGWRAATEPSGDGPRR
jgi:GntR family transcriptional regulator, transcriptional repressor for pyruvate dehydrogenase complex